MWTLGGAPSLAPRLGTQQRRELGQGQRTARHGQQGEEAQEPQPRSLKSRRNQSLTTELQIEQQLMKQLNQAARQQRR